MVPCADIVKVLNAEIGGGRDSAGQIRGNGGTIMCHFEGPDTTVFKSEHCPKDAWYLSQTLQWVLPPPPHPALKKIDPRAPPWRVWPLSHIRCKWRDV